MYAQQLRRDDGSALLDLAEEVARDCGALADCLAALEASPCDQLEESCLRSLERIRLLRARVSAGADELRSAPARGLPLSPGAQGALDARMAEAAHLLRQAASSYSRLTDKVSLLLNEVGQRLIDVQRGGQVLRSYARTARPAK